MRILFLILSKCRMNVNMRMKKNNTENFDFNSLSNNKSDNLNNPIDGDINKFLKWLTLILYSGDHSVIITEDKGGINIRLVKINKGKK